MSAGMFGMPPGFGFPTIDNATIIISSSAAGTGIFIYNGAPGVGNLILSDAAPGVTADPFGNTVRGGGTTVYGAGGSEVFLGIIGAGTPAIVFYSGASIEENPGQITSDVLGSGAAEFIGLDIFGPQISAAGFTDRVFIELNSSTEGGPATANGEFVYVSPSGADALIAYWDTTGFVHVTSASLLNSSAPLVLAGRTQLYSGSGHLKYVGTDNSVYNTGRQTSVGPGQALTVASANLTGLTSINVGIGTYRFHACLQFVNSAGVPTVTIGLAGPAITSARLMTRWETVGVAATASVNQLTTLGSTTSPAFTATGTSMLEIEGVIVFSAAGIFGLTGDASAATITLQANSFMDLMPVTS